MTEEAIRARKEYLKKYRKDSKDKINEYMKNYRKKYPEKIKQYEINYWEKKALGNANENTNLKGA